MELETHFFGRPMSYWLWLSRHIDEIPDGDSMARRMIMLEREANEANGKLAVMKDAIARLNRSVEKL